MELFDFSNARFVAFFMVCVCVLAVWELVWKGLALWKSAKNNHSLWFVFILIFNTAGILPIIYLLLNRTKNE